MNPAFAVESVDRSRERRVHVAALLLIASLAGLLWIHRVYIDQPPAYGYGSADLLQYYYPAASYLHQELWRGHFPVWNPHQLAGMPFLALHHPGPVYPPNLLLMGLLAPARALEAGVVLHLVIAGFGMWLFTARLGLTPAARLAAVSAYMLSGQLFRWYFNISYLATLVWLPLIMWAVHGLLQTQRLRWVGALSLTTGLAFLAGCGQGFVYELQFALGYAVLGLWLLAPPGRRLRALVLVVAAVAVMTGAVAVQLLPAVELATNGTRSVSGVPFEMAAGAALAPAALFKGLLGASDVAVPNAFQWPGWRQASAPLLTVPLILLGFGDRRRRSQWIFFLVAAVLLGAFMLGAQTPVFRIYYELPFGRTFRIPVRIGFVYAFALSTLIGIGVQGAGELCARWRGNGRVALIVTWVLVFAVGGDLYRRSAFLYRHPVLGPDLHYASDELVEYLRRGGGRERAFVMSRPFVATRESPRSKLGMMHGLFSLPEYDALFPRAYWDYFIGAVDPKVARSDQAMALWRGDLPLLMFLRRDPPVHLGRALDLMSVRYYVVDSALSAEVEAMGAFAGGSTRKLGSATVIERPTALPRVYVVNRATAIADRLALIAQLGAPDFEPAREVLVERPVPGLGTGRAGSDVGSAGITSYEPTEVVVEASCETACLLVLTDVHYPGWGAEVDGREAEVIRVNGLFRGVLLAPGEHHVVYRFRSRSIARGAAISGATLLLVLAVAVGRRHST